MTVPFMCKKIPRSNASGEYIIYYIEYSRASEDAQYASFSRRS